MMQRKNFFLLTFFLVTIAWFMPLFAQTIDIDAARKEARVVVYAAVPPQTMNVINDPFEKSTESEWSIGALRPPASWKER